MSPPTITAAWLADDPAATALFPRAYARPADRAAAVAAAARRRVDPRALDSLARAAARHPTARRNEHLAALAEPGAVCVVTGQQAGLFGGPAFTLYKAAAAVVTARTLQAETGVRAVPVFWLQVEDHDYAEIATTYTWRGAEIEPVSVVDEAPDPRVSVASRQLGSSVTLALDALESSLAGLSDAAPTLALLRAHYRPDASPAAAFQALIDALFAEHGLLCLDPTDPELAPAAASFYQADVADADARAAALTARADALLASGFRPQVHVRPGAPLAFFHPDGPTGPRYRLEPTPDGFRLAGGPERLISRGALLDAPPTAFSTSALLRPLLQDTWLPTAAYIGGPGEIAYLAQLAPLYARDGIAQPLVIPRARLQVLDETTDRLLGQLDLTPGDLDQPRDALLTTLGRPLPGYPSPEALAERWLPGAQVALDAFTPQAAELDRGLAKAVEHTRAAITDLTERLLDRYRRTLARRDEITTQRLDRLLTRLRPLGLPQERVIGWPWLAARFGVSRFTEATLAAITPYDHRLRDLRP